MRTHATVWGDSRAIEPEEGANVVTIDEKRLGIVRASVAGYFLVHVRWGRDYWLSCELIRKHEPGRTVLNISRSVLNRYRQRQPDQVARLQADGDHSAAQGTQP